MKVKANVKGIIRISILTASLVGTFIAAAVQPVPAQDGGPLILCPPNSAHCTQSQPPQ